MKKKLLILLCSLLLRVSLVGCGNSDKKEYKYRSIGDRTFFIISCNNPGNCWDIYVDTETRVQYMIINGDLSYSSSTSVLVDAEGKPILYEGEIE